MFSPSKTTFLCSFQHEKTNSGAFPIPAAFGPNKHHGHKSEAGGNFSAIYNVCKFNYLIIQQLFFLSKSHGENGVLDHHSKQIHESKKVREVKIFREQRKFILQNTVILK